MIRPSEPGSWEMPKRYQSQQSPDGASLGASLIAGYTHSSSTGTRLSHCLITSDVGPWDIWARSGNGSWVLVTELFLTADALQGRLEVKHPEVWAGLETEYCLFRLNGRGWRGKRRLLCMTVCPCDGCPYDCVRYRVCSFMLVSLRGMIVNVRSCVILCASVGYPVTLCPCDGCVLTKIIFHFASHSLN